MYLGDEAILTRQDSAVTLQSLSVKVRSGFRHLCLSMIPVTTFSYSEVFQSLHVLCSKSLQNFPNLLQISGPS